MRKNKWGWNVSQRMYSLGTADRLAKEYLYGGNQLTKNIYQEFKNYPLNYILFRNKMLKSDKNR